MKLRLAHLYPKLMNIYGDRGNIMALRHRCEARGIEFELTELELGDRFDPDAYDMAFMGGAQDVEQRRVAEDFRTVKGASLRAAVEDGFVFLAVCGGYQLAGHYYRRLRRRRAGRRRHPRSAHNPPRPPGEALHRQRRGGTGRRRRSSASRTTAGARTSVQACSRWRAS